MKITFEIPNTTMCLTLSGVYETDNGLSMGVKAISTKQIENGEEIVCDWESDKHE